MAAGRSRRWSRRRRTSTSRSTEIAEQFARDRAARVEIVFGASGTLARQIQEGAPFELFLAADEEFPNRLATAGLTRDAGVVYASGRLVLFAPNGSPLAVDDRLEGLEQLVKSGRVGRFAIANPDVAPYGKAAEAVLRKRGLWDAMRPTLVLGDTIAQAAQFATTGNAIGGLIAYSIVLESRVLPSAAAMPSFLTRDHPPLRQRMVLSPARRRRRDAVLRLPARRCCARDPDESTATARRNSRWTGRPLRYRCGWVPEPASCCCRPASGVRVSSRCPRLSRQGSGRGAADGAARASANGARLLSTGHLRRALATRAGISGAGRPEPAVLVRGLVAGLGYRQHPVCRSADPARLRSDSARTCAMPLRAAG